MARTILAWLAATMLMVSCQAVVPAETKTVMGGDGRPNEATFEAAQPRRSDVAREAAMAVALEHLKVVDPGVVVDDARFVVVALRVAEDGATILSRRRAWWVVVKGERFPVTACMCDGSPYNLGTAVVVDAESGGVVTTVGVSRDSD
ncbi:MAG: hypothetical protein EPO26_01905 [Chloroflexota bacterium]|nr:MAG: hypothetical protein EPO26_01905 [Chloroflexota bacterium]